MISFIGPDSPNSAPVMTMGWIERQHLAEKKTSIPVAELHNISDSFHFAGPAETLTYPCLRISAVLIPQQPP